MTNCSGKTTKGEPCKRKAVDGLLLEDEPVCKQHYANAMLAIKMAEINALKVPENIVVEPPVKCVGMTKKGEACKNDGIKDHEGLCKAHYKIFVKEREKTLDAENDPKPAEPMVPKTKCKGLTTEGKECKNYEADACEGYCKRHHDKMNKPAEPSEPSDPKKASKKASKEAKASKPSPISDKSVDELLAEAKRLAMPKMPAKPAVDAESPFLNLDIPEIETV
jgi:hypothetical protein